MKIHTCKICGYTSTRKEVRKHLKEVHGIKGVTENAIGVKTQSQFSDNTKC